MIQRIFPGRGERRGLFQHARAPSLDDEGGKITLQGQERRDLRATSTTGVVACTSCWSRRWGSRSSARADRHDDRAHI